MGYKSYKKTIGLYSEKKIISISSSSNLMRNIKAIEACKKLVSM